MKKVKVIAVALIASFMAASAAYADKDITLNWSNGETITVNVPDDLATIINEHKSDIEKALTGNNVSAATASGYVNQAKDAYTDFLKKSGISTKTPYKTVVNGLNDLTDIMTDVIPNTQLQQNVWADAWIGHILPKPNFGFGVNAGVSKLKLDSLKSAGEALGMDMGSVPSTMVFPVATVDLRLGGFFLPFDVGFTISGLDTSKIGPLNKAISPAYFDYFTIGGDIRYALLKGSVILPKVSVGLGIYHMRGHIGADKDGSSAEMDFKATTLSLSAQVSKKLVFFVPFAGARVMFTSSSVNWKAKANWEKILGAKGSLAEAIKYNILPQTFSGGTDKGLFEHVRPVIYGGFAFDLAVIDITVSGSYDFVSSIPSGAVSVRFALH